MKVIVVALALVALAAAGPVPDAVLEPIKILRSEFDVHPVGGYTYPFHTENNIHRDENGEIKEALNEENKPIMRGSYYDINEQGERVTVNYWVDETGFHTENDSIPKAPEAAARR